MTPPAPPWTVSAPQFAFRALAQAAAKAPLGGAREALGAVLVAARLAQGHTPGRALPLPLLTERAAAARHWLGALALPAGLRSALLQLVDASGQGNDAGVRLGIQNVTEVTAPLLDRKARLELDALARQLVR